jgi:hypothetical protein
MAAQVPATLHCAKVSLLIVFETWLGEFLSHSGQYGTEITSPSLAYETRPPSAPSIRDNNFNSVLLYEKSILVIATTNNGLCNIWGFHGCD